ncbi:MAG: baseplate J/gp47 family protein [Polyangiales bacterium]
MSLTVAELLSPRTRDQIADDILAALTAAGFPVTAWQPGSVPRVLVFAFAATLAVLWGLVAQVGAAAFLDTATGAWLTLHAFGRFSLTRIAATFARHTFTLNNGAGSPVTITPGQLLLTTAAGAVRYRSTNTSNVTVPASGSTPITVQAETAGIAGNTVPTILVTPAVAGLSISAGALSTRARNEETDGELRTRCRARWATLAAGATRDFYLYHLLNATLADGVTNAGVTRVGWIAPAGDGTFEVVVAGADGPLSPTPLGDVRAYVAVQARKAYTDTPTITNATAVQVTPSATIYVRAAYNTNANRTKAVDALAALAASLEIGQTLDLGAVYRAIYAAEGVTDVDLASPSGDTATTNREVIEIITSNIADASNWEPV